MSDVVVTMSGDVARLIRDQERAIKKQGEMIDKLQRTQQAGKAAGESAQQAAATTEKGWSRVGTEITSMIGKYGGMAAAAALAGKAIQRLVQQLNAMADEWQKLQGQDTDPG